MVAVGDRWYIQLRGELVGEKSNEGTDSQGIGLAMKRPKIATVNEQIRGQEAGQQTNNVPAAFAVNK